MGITRGLLAAILGASLTASCSPSTRSAGAEAAPAEAGAAPAPETLVPDVESDTIPTAGGIPLVPLTGEVNFLDALDPQPVHNMPHFYNTNHTAVQIIKEEETLQLEAYELGGLWLIGYGHLMLEGEKDVITEEEADAFLRDDLHWCEEAIERYVKVPDEFSGIRVQRDGRVLLQCRLRQDPRLIHREARQWRRPPGRSKRLPAVEQDERRGDESAGQPARTREDAVPDAVRPPRLTSPSTSPNLRR